MPTILRILLVLLVIPPALVVAYDLGYHEDITHRALSNLGFTVDARRMVSNYNLAVDIKVNTIGLVTGYLRKQHFDDRFRFEAHRALREELLADLDALRQLDCSDDDDVYTYAAAAGLVHHAFQDFYAHSNHTEVTSLALQGTSILYPAPTFDDVLQPTPGLDSVRSAWLANVELDVGEALISGAFFGPLPDILDIQGNRKSFHHDILNKDKPVVSGEYLYNPAGQGGPRLDRQLMHQRSTRVATREMQRLDRRLLAVNAGCYDALRTYEFGILEEVWQASKRAIFKAAGLVSRHWRSGSFVFEGDELQVTVTAPTVYPDNPPTARTSWTYEVENVGLSAVKTVRLFGDEALQISDAVWAPVGWTVERDGGAIEWTAEAGAEIQPGARQSFEFKPARIAVPGAVELITDEGRRAQQMVGPVTPDWFDASFLRAVSLLSGLDEDDVLADAGIPPDRRTPPFQAERRPRSGSGYEGLIVVAVVVVLAVVLVRIFVWLAARRGRDKGPGTKSRDGSAR